MTNADTQEIQHEMLSLARQVVLGQSNCVDFTKRQFNGVREKALLYLYNHAVDLSDGCERLASAGLPTSLAPADLPISLTTLSRSLVETLFWERWVILSEDNATKFRAAARNEAKGLAKVLLETGHAVLKRTQTGENVTKAFLNSRDMKKIPKLPKIEKVADATGLAFLYNVTYRILSLHIHGMTYEFLDDMPPKRQVHAALSTASASMECINLIAKNWIGSRQLTEASEILKILHPVNVS